MKIIHQVWLQGVDNILKDKKVFIEKWRYYHPEWTHCIWDFESLFDLCEKEMPWFTDTFKSLPHWVCIVDAAKYLLLYLYGGIYADMDTMPLKSLDSLLIKYGNYEIIVSECDESVTWVEKFVMGRNMKPFVNSGVIYSTPKLELWSDLLWRMKARNQLRIKKKIFVDEMYIVDFSGPGLLSDFINEAKTYKIKILPFEVFEGRDMLCNAAYVLHYHNQSWMSKNLWDQYEYVLFTVRYGVYILLLGIMVIIVYQFFFKKNRLNEDIA